MIRESGIPSGLEIGGVITFCTPYSLSQMDQSTAVLFFAKRGLSATQIEGELRAILGGEAMPYSTITYTLRSRSWTHTTPDTIENPLDDAIRQTLDNIPFASVRQIAHRLCQSSTTINRHLTGAWGFVLKYLRWVSDILTTTQKADRVGKSGELLRLLRSMNNGRRHVSMTLDEFWFYFHQDHSVQQLPPGEKSAVSERVTAQAPKLILTIVWNTDRFHVVEILPKAAWFNADYFCNSILRGLLPDDGDVGRKKMVIQADNARNYTGLRTRAFMAENSMKSAPHPPYSPDLAPSDFYIFAYVKKRLTGQMFQSRNDLFEAIIEIPRSIPMEKLMEVFLEWERRLHGYIDIDGEYFE
jgi:transposase